MYKVLVCDDDAGLRLSVQAALAATGRFEVDEAFDGVNAVEKVKSKTYNMVLLDVDMPRMNGLEALKVIKEHDPSIIVLILTAYANIDDAVRAVKEGAFNYVSKPIKSEDLVSMVDRAINAYSLISQASASFAMQVEPGREIIGHTSQMKKVFNVIMRLSKVDTPVLIRGASGTGKELVARAIHSNSSFKDGKFVAINCSAIPENLFESELFGHEKGSFTGADQRKIGKFQYAVLGRNRRLAVADAGETTARTARKDVHARRREPRDRVERPHYRGDQSSLGRDEQEGHVPRRLVLPLECDADQLAFVERTQGRYRSSGELVHSEIQPRAKQEGRRRNSRSLGRTEEVRMAGQHSRAREHHGARVHLGRIEHGSGQLAARVDFERHRNGALGGATQSA
jgi:CheY-like chemotaxis protein